MGRDSKGTRTGEAFGRDSIEQVMEEWNSFAEAGERLFTSLRSPGAQRKALRTTNAPERINEEFRRRSKTRASLPSEDAVLLLFFDLIRSGQITLRHMAGWGDRPPVNHRSNAA